MPAACILEFSEFVNQNVHALLDDAALRLGVRGVHSPLAEREILFARVRERTSHTAPPSLSVAVATASSADLEQFPRARSISLYVVSCLMIRSLTLTLAKSLPLISRWKSSQRRECGARLLLDSRRLGSLPYR